MLIFTVLIVRLASLEVSQVFPRLTAGKREVGGLQEEEKKIPEEKGEKKKGDGG